MVDVAEAGRRVGKINRSHQRDSVEMRVDEFTTRERLNSLRYTASSMQCEFSQVDRNA